MAFDDARDFEKLIPVDEDDELEKLTVKLPLLDTDDGLAVSIPESTLATENIT